MDDSLLLAGKRYESRLIVGTGKYKDVEQTEAAIDASGAEIVTVALRRVDLNDRSSGSLMGLLMRRQTEVRPEAGRRPEGHTNTEGRRWTLLPNSAGCFSADEAVRTLRLALP